MKARLMFPKGCLAKSINKISRVNPESLHSAQDSFQDARSYIMKHVELQSAETSLESKR